MLFRSSGCVYKSVSPSLKPPIPQNVYCCKITTPFTDCQAALSIHVNPSFSFPHLLSRHTPTYSHTSLSVPSFLPSLSFSLTLLLCEFCFGAVIFRLISEVMHFLQIKEEARLFLPPQSSVLHITNAPHAVPARVPKPDSHF